MLARIRRMRAEQRARWIVRTTGLSALSVAAGTLLIPRQGMRAIGLEADGRGFDLIAGLFASRDAVIGIALLRVAGDERPDPRWLDMIALSQAGDMAVAGWLAGRGRLSRRGLATIVLTAAPTAIATLAVRGTWRRAGG